MRQANSRLILVVFVLVFCGFLFSTFFYCYEYPHLNCLSLKEVAVGEYVTLKGHHLGNSHTSSLFVGGYEVLPRFIKEWTPTSITFKVCEAMGSGLVFVKNGFLTSNSLFFINRSHIPDFSFGATMGTCLLSLNSEKLTPTKEFMIKGLFLGLKGEQKDIFFSYWDGKEKTVRLPRSNLLSWGDNYVRFLMPVGVSSGNLYLEDKNGFKSNALPYYVEERAARWQLGKSIEHTFKILVTLKREIKDEKESFYFGLPEPKNFFSVELGCGTACLNAYRKEGWLFYQISGSSEPCICLEQTYSLRADEVEVFVNPDLIKPYSKQSAEVLCHTAPSCLWGKYTNLQELIKSFKLIPLDNPYECAREVYNRFLLEFSPSEQPLDWALLNKNERGLSFAQFNTLFVDTLKYMGIPAREVLGFLYSEKTNEYHLWQWAEIYFDELGWAPIDISLGFIKKGDYIFKLSANHIPLADVPHNLRAVTMGGQLHILKDSKGIDLTLISQPWLYEKVKGKGSLSLVGYQIVPVNDKSGSTS